MTRDDAKDIFFAYTGRGMTLEDWWGIELVDKSIWFLALRLSTLPSYKTSPVFKYCRGDYGSRLAAWAIAEKELEAYDPYWESEW